MQIRQRRHLCATATLAVTASLLLSGCSDSSNNDTTSSSANPPATDSAAIADPSATVDSPPDDSKVEIVLDERSVQAVASDLQTPAGLAVQPGSGHILVSTAAGVLRLDPDRRFSVTIEIDGFENDVYGKGPEYNIGPLGLGFLDETTLVVGGGDLDDGEDVIRFYEVGPAARDTPMSAATAVHAVGPIPKGADSHRGEGNYFGLLVHDSNVFVTSHGDDTKGWLSRIDCSGETPGNLQPLIAVKKSTHLDGPSGIAFQADGLMVVSVTGELTEFPDAVLAVFDPETGELQKTVSTELHDITAILMHPTDGRLYALDFAWAAPEKGGLYSIDLSSEPPTVTKHATLLHPTAMACTTGGQLVISCVENQEDESAGQGRIYTVSVE